MIDENGLIKCNGCGKVLGKLESDEIVIKNKGRVTREGIPPWLTITCEGKKCKTVNTVIQKSGQKASH